MIFHVGIDAMDESAQPLRRGITVERIAAATGTAQSAADETLARFREDASFKMIGEPTIQTIRLADGNDAVLLSVSAYRGGERRTAIGKLFAVKGGNRFVASGFVTAGRNSKLAGVDGAAFTQLLAHLRTFSTDPNQFDPRSLEARPGE
jgi:hypothetical protein